LHPQQPNVGVREPDVACLCREKLIAEVNGVSYRDPFEKIHRMNLELFMSMNKKGEPHVYDCCN
jgi:hypothetical protein